MTELLSTLIGALAALGGVWSTGPAQHKRDATTRVTERERDAAAHQAAMVCDVQVACQLVVRAAGSTAYGTKDEHEADRDLVTAFAALELAKARIVDDELLRRTDELPIVASQLAMTKTTGGELASLVSELIDAARAHSDGVRDLLVELPPPGPAAGSLFEALRSSSAGPQ